MKNVKILKICKNISKQSMKIPVIYAIKTLKQTKNYLTTFQKNTKKKRSLFISGIIIDFFLNSKSSRKMKFFTFSPILLKLFEVKKGTIS